MPTRHSAVCMQSYATRDPPSNPSLNRWTAHISTVRIFFNGRWQTVDAGHGPKHIHDSLNGLLEGLRSHARPPAH